MYLRLTPACKEVGRAFSKPVEETIRTIAVALRKRDRDAHANKTTIQ